MNTQETINKFPNRCSVEQTVQINELLSADEDYFNLAEIFRYIPEKMYDKEGHRGDRFVSDTEISYSSIGPDWKLHLIASFPIPINGDIFDAFIKILEFIQNDNNKTTTGTV